jgi:succinate-semialdehyde dehydrogenase/glutarate-semialdehyde dehydrogenase
MTTLFSAEPAIRCAQLYIDGTWRDGACRRAAEVLDPASEAVAGTVAHAEETDVDLAIEAATRALPGWRATTLDERGAILLRAAVWLSARMEVAALALTTEQGKPLAEARAELTRTVDTLLWHATRGRAACLPYTAPDGSTNIRPEPLGVVAAFTPWNYPAVIIARKLAAALIAGCTVVLKAAEETPTIATMIVAALAEAGLPGGVVNLLFGDPPAISARLIASSDVRALSFTGSTAVGKQLATRAGATLVRCVLELGGHAPVIVCADADVDAAAQAIAA